MSSYMYFNKNLIFCWFGKNESGSGLAMADDGFCFLFYKNWFYKLGLYKSAIIAALLLYCARGAAIG